MRVDELPQRSQPDSRRAVSVLIAADDPQDQIARCVESVGAHVPAATAVLVIASTAAAVNRELERLAPSDVVVLDEASLVSEGWLERLREAACEDTNIATASALSDAGTELALCETAVPADGVAELARGLADRTLRLHPRLSRAVGPCVYVRREAVELVGALDEELDLPRALEIDFAQRCLLSGLAHVAADDVVIARLSAPRPSFLESLPQRVLERYPYLEESPALGESAVLAHALEVARGPRPGLWVTLDARALDGAVTGTHVHILELIRALANTSALRLRVLVREARIDRRVTRLAALAAGDRIPGGGRRRRGHAAEHRLSQAPADLLRPRTSSSPCAWASGSFSASST